MASLRTPHAKYFRHRLYPRLRHGRRMQNMLADFNTLLGATATGQTVTPVNATNTKAQSLVTFGGNPAALDTLTIGNFTYSFVTALAEAKAVGTLTNDATNVTATDTVTIGSNVYTFKAATTEAKAVGTLTNDGVNVTALDTVTLGANTYTFVTALSEAKAVSTLTNDGTNVVDGDQVSIGTVTYTFQATLTNVAGNIKIGASNTASMTNLFNGINATGGVVGTDYATLCVAHPLVVATNPTGTTVLITAKSFGTAGNAITTTKFAAAHLSWTGGALTGGVNAIANQVKVGAANTNSMTNLFEAINGTPNLGTDFSTGTVAHPIVVATNPSGTTVVATGLLVGVAGNIASTKVSTHLSWGAATLVGGVDSIVGEVKVGAANTNSMTNLFNAINATGGVKGTDYSSAGVAHPTVVATNPSGTTVVATAKSFGTAGNAIVTTRTAGTPHVSWGAGTLVGGVNPVANQIFIGAAATNTRDNVVAAITAGAGSGTTWDSTTVVHDKVTAAASSGNMLVTALLTADVTPGKSVPLAKSSAGITLAGTALDGPGWTATTHPFVDGEGPMYLVPATAVGTLTNTGVNLTNRDTVTIDTQVYTYKTALTEAKATVLLTNDGTNVSNGDTVNIAGKTYTFQSTLLNMDGNVNIGGSNTASMTNLFNAINGTGGVRGTDYATATVAHTLVVATNPSGTTVRTTAKLVGTAANAFVSTKVAAHLSWGSATFLGGLASVANEVFIGASAAASTTNLFEAINAGANAGVDYSSATVAHPTVTATNPTGTTVVATARLAGVTGNSIATTKVAVTMSWGGATLAGAGTLPTGTPINALTGKSQELWLHKIDANTVALAAGVSQGAGAQGALSNGDFLQTTSAGSGTLTLLRGVDSRAMFDLLKRNQVRTVATATDVDNLK